MKSGCPAIATLFLVLAQGCGDGTSSSAEPLQGGDLKVMTRNLFLGGELVPIVLVGSLAEIPTKVAAFWSTVQASDIPARLALVADEIAAAKPDLVGLQEVELFRMQAQSDFSFSAPAINADYVVYDFLALLTAALADKGAHYKVAVESFLSDNEMPGMGPDGKAFDLRMTDRDAILIREDLPFSNAQAKVMTNHVEVNVGGTGGVPVKIMRGYETVDVPLVGRTVTFGNSHLEVGGPLQVYQEAQAYELVTAVGGIKGNLVLVGDFNSASDLSGTKSYKYLAQDARLTDAYAQVHPGDPGQTCCTDIGSPTFMSQQRIDIVWTKGSVRGATAEVTGTGPDRRTPSGLWASDHAGVVAGLQLLR